MHNVQYENKAAFHECRRMILPDHTGIHPSRPYFVHIIRRVDQIKPLIFVFDAFGWAVDDSKTINAARKEAKRS